MAKFTKNAIIASFIKLLNKYPFDKITVKDIVEDCGVNRNTFYYYFQDIYSLLDELLRNETERSIAENNVMESWDKGIMKSLSFVFENKTAIRHLYSSINREELEKYLYNITESLMIQFVRQEAVGVESREEDIRLIADFYNKALVGLALDWIGRGMPDDIYAKISRLHELFNGGIHEAFIRVEGK